MVAEALTRAHSCFNHPHTGGYGDEEKWRSTHHTVDHQRATRREEALKRGEGVVVSGTDRHAREEVQRQIRASVQVTEENFILKSCKLW